VSLDARDAAAHFGPRRLKLARQLRGYTRAELARRAGLSAAAISQYESAAHVPRSGMLAQLAMSLGVPVAFLANPGTPTLLPTIEESFFAEAGADASPGPSVRPNSPRCSHLRITGVVLWGQRVGQDALAAALAAQLVLV
jgi:transcriptional regulator with XRE-family HTH domain